MGNQNIDRRSFLKGAAATAATVIGSNLASGTQLAANAAAAQSDNSNAETHGSGRSSEKIIARPGSDFMVDVIKATGIEYIASNPGSSFRSLQESIVNYGDNKKPEFLTCMHEESSVGHGPRLRQSSGQADGHDGAWDRRAAARRDGGVQRLVRPRAGGHVRRQLPRRRQAASGRRMVSLRAGSGRAAA